MMKDRILKITKVALSAAFIALGATLSIPATPSFSLQTLCIFIVSAFLTPVEALSAGVVYLALGAVGLPIFANFAGGFGVLLSVSGGFLISFPFILYISSTFLRKFRRSTFIYAFTFSVATIVSYVIGALWIQILNFYDGSFGKMLIAHVIPFIPFDALKIAFGAFAVKKFRSILNGELEKSNKNNSAK